MTTETSPNVYEQVVENMKAAAESNLKMQQDMFRQWTAMWPGFPSPQAVWLDKVRDFQKQWSNTVSDLARKHRSTLDKQYQAALESLEEALRAGQSGNPEEFRQRTEQLCRRTLDTIREVSEAQMHESQEAMNKWSELFTKAGT
jgi:ElaB/YqjD/DUF883 family membrane-anchored ribosome-binding protein